LACDGGKSTVRERLKIPFDGAPDQYTYLMGDFRDITGWGNKACFFLTARGSVESFTLSGGNRRFVIRTPAFIQEYATGYLATELLSRCGINVSGAGQLWESGFGVQHYMARRFCTDRIFLCGDAAHLMSPIGGQNMNTGFADAELAAWLTGILLINRDPHHLVSRLYNRVRREAALSALRRARWMMLIGTSGGSLWSAVRNLVATSLLHTPLRRYLMQLFSMHSIPYRNLKSSQKEYEKELKL
jgi:2-polyprenyl-6-methoxyphenol hydroxylase-like FAD-dependent oxidoreductase